LCQYSGSTVFSSGSGAATACDVNAALIIRFGWRRRPLRACKAKGAHAAEEAAAAAAKQWGKQQQQQQQQRQQRQQRQQQLEIGDFSFWRATSIGIELYALLDSQ
jgi:fructose-1,6-bisphosphatase/sedoheptulose 1,7-bisphosphatase-like protein